MKIEENIKFGIFESKKKFEGSADEYKEVSSEKRIPKIKDDFITLTGITLATFCFTGPQLIKLAFSVSKKNLK